MNLPANTFMVGNKWYGRCEDCEQIVRLDKPLLGSIHFCLTDEEKAAKRAMIAAALRQQQAAILRGDDLASNLHTLLG